MAFITKIDKHPLGEFSISFSTKRGRFEIKYPEGIADKVSSAGAILNNWEDVQKELDRIKYEYLYKVLLLKKVIIIQLQTSESTFDLIKQKLYHVGNENKMESRRTDDYLNGVEGFNLKWYIAEEYLYPRNSKRYKIIEANKNSTMNFERIDIIEQLLFSGGEKRVLDYSEDLHRFLQSLDGKISQMMKQLVSYFDINNDKFMENFQTNKLKLLGQ